MKHYELTYLLSPDIGESEIKSIAQKLDDSITAEGGEVSRKEDNTPKIKLAYPVKKKDWAFLASLYFNLEPSKLEQVEKQIKTEAQVLRHIIISRPYQERKAQGAFLRRTRVRRAPGIPFQEKGAAPDKRQREVIQKVELNELDQKIEEMLQ